MDEPTSNLNQTALFSGASEKLLTVLDAGFTKVALKTGQAIFDQGDHDDRLYVLDTGLLEVSVLSVSGKKLSLNQIRPGEAFGEIAIFDPGPRTARVEALSDSVLRAIKRQKLMADLGGSPDLAEELLRLAGRRMRWMSQQMEDHVFLPLQARLASRLVQLAGTNKTVQMSQAQLADYIGVTREVVSKTLADWRRSGIVDVSRGKIILTDREALVDLMAAGFI